MNYKTTMYEPLRQEEQGDKSMHANEDDEEDDEDKIQPKCFNFKTEIKVTIKYLIKECPKIF